MEQDQQDQQYDSVKTVAIYKKGKGTVKMQRVHVKNGKGYKEVVYKHNGRVTRRSRKPLTKKEAKALCTCKFVPTLFRSCNQECLGQSSQ
jgi:hypothetical protein